MHAIDRLHRAHPCMGARMLGNQLQRDGFSVGRQHVRTLMRRVGIHAIYRKPRNASESHPTHKIYP
jgi:putative transposase